MRATREAPDSTDTPPCPQPKDDLIARSVSWVTSQLRNFGGYDLPKLSFNSVGQERLDLLLCGCPTGTRDVIIKYNLLKTHWNKLYRQKWLLFGGTAPVYFELLPAKPVGQLSTGRAPGKDASLLPLNPSEIYPELPAAAPCPAR